MMTEKKCDYICLANQITMLAIVKECRYQVMFVPQNVVPLHMQNVHNWF